jgi:hypothetical protein
MARNDFSLPHLKILFSINLNGTRWEEEHQALNGMMSWGFEGPTETIGYGIS